MCQLILTISKWERGCQQEWLWAQCGQKTVGTVEPRLSETAHLSAGGCALCGRANYEVLPWTWLEIYPGPESNTAESAGRELWMDCPWRRCGESRRNRERKGDGRIRQSCRRDCREERRSKYVPLQVWNRWVGEERNTWIPVDHKPWGDEEKSGGNDRSRSWEMENREWGI